MYGGHFFIPAAQILPQHLVNYSLCGETRRANCFLQLKPPAEAVFNASRNSVIPRFLRKQKREYQAGTRTFNANASIIYHNRPIPVKCLIWFLRPLSVIFACWRGSNYRLLCRKGLEKSLRGLSFRPKQSRLCDFRLLRCARNDRWSECLAVSSSKEKI